MVVMTNVAESADVMKYVKIKKYKDRRLYRQTRLCWKIFNQDPKGQGNVFIDRGNQITVPKKLLVNSRAAKYGHPEEGQKNRHN